MNKLKGIEEALEGFYKGKTALSEQLIDSILYSVHAGGKRIRPLLLLEVLEALGIILEKSHYQVAAALEMIHTGSLIHDDLPAMDNDDYRRGQLTNHKEFDEATAILAGDSLFLDPFGLIASSQLKAEIKVKLILLLSQASGTFGMVGGQMLDMQGEGQKLDLDALQKIHNHKTGDLLVFPFSAAAVIAELDKNVEEKLYQAGRTLGHAFQVRDDILDLTADFDKIGKTPMKDLVSEKATYPSLLGIEKSYQVLNNDLDVVIAIFKELESEISFRPESLIAITERLRLDA